MDYEEIGIRKRIEEAKKMKYCAKQQMAQADIQIGEYDLQLLELNKNKEEKISNHMDIEYIKENLDKDLTTKLLSEKFKVSSCKSFWLFSKRRMTTFSPLITGKVDTLKSTLLPLTSTSTRPSWGKRFSAMSMPQIILIRETMALWFERSTSTTLHSKPSMRRRTRVTSSNCSMWMSLAFFLTASSNNSFTNFTACTSPDKLLLKTFCTANLLSFTGLHTSFLLS